MAWYDEMQAVHGRLRRALDLVRDTAHDDDPSPSDPVTDLLVYCRGFCTALTWHHTAEDAVLFPELERRHPDLADVLRRLSQDHGMIAYLVADLEHALDRATDPAASRDAVVRHLDGVGAIMESHFRYEERALGGVLAALDLRVPRRDVLGPL
ncbi:hemerythrin domain-containing protein [Cellulosimicrobium composti]|uniref:hemerythrin domain-containing protein n=1 Tax=Cellulosimicrobium composti TaxID=2672572 RepID=UPI0037A0C2DA